MMKNSFMLYIDQYAPIQTLSLEQKGQLLDAFFSYNMGEEVSLDDPVLAMAFSFFRQSFERDTEKYERKCQKNRDNVKSRYTNSTNVDDGSDRIPELRTNTNATDNDNDPDNDIFKETLTSFESSSPPPGEDQPRNRPDGREEQAPEGQEHASPEGRKNQTAPACPYQQVVDLYHEALPEHARVKLLTASRQKAVKARWADVGRRLQSLKQASGEQERLSWLQRYFGKAAQSPFLTGQVRQRDRPPFMADFDFLMSPRGFAGVIEDKYDDREGR